MAGFRKLDALAVAGKRVLVRVDLNVPMQDGKVTDAYRIERLVSTVKFLTERGAKVVLMSHFGRPKNGYSAENSLFQLMDTLSAALGGQKIAFASDCIGPIAEEIVAALAPGDIALLENLRFHPGEEANDPAFAAALAKFGDFYVNDAFSVSHRAHTSTAGLAALLPCAAGLLMQAELEALGAALDHPQRPVVALVGGSKVSTKIDLLNSLVTKVDCLVIGGAMANTLLLAQGVSVGKSLAEADRIATAHEILATAEKCGCKILLPTDAVVADKLAIGIATEIVPIHQVPADKMILDVGPATVAAILARIAQSKTLVWNGPVGAFEFPPFDAATVAIAKGVADRVKAGSLLAVAGGGDTVAALAHAGVIDDLSYVSTAGGAFLEWLEGRVLPGVKALDIS